MSYNFLIVGAGFFGATIARLLTDRGAKCLVLEKEPESGGHAATCKMKDIVVHKYGPHIFHTNNEEVWRFVNKYAEFNNFNFKVKVNYNNILYSFPINLLTLSQVYGVTTPVDAAKAIERDRIIFIKPANFEEMALSTIGKKLYETFFYGYTKKQWGCEPKELSAEVFNRLPVRFDFNDNYFNNHRNKYQGIPIGGYTNLINNILKDIPIIHNVDYLQDKDYWNSQTQRVIFTGPIDEYYNFQFGKLPYRSLRFEWQTLDNTFQGGPVVNYTDEKIPWTRITEHKYFENNTCEHSVISKEYPAKYEETRVPFYPINNSTNDGVYDKYKSLANTEKRLYFGGRLAEYKYYDMDQVIESAFQLSKTIR